jgi:hypothetical protein
MIGHEAPEEQKALMQSADEHRVRSAIGGGAR